MSGRSLYENGWIEVSGAKVNNLKNISVNIQRNRLTVITGLSGSGKSSLAFDTIYAEGQRRYVESLSAYARQFLGRMHKPEVDFIRGIPPAIAIEQRVNTRNPRSTVGTSTEIYDYLKLLFARIGETVSPVSGEVVQKDTPTDVVDFICQHAEGTRLHMLCPMPRNISFSFAQRLEDLKHQGITRLEINGRIMKLEEAVQITEPVDSDQVNILIDRISVARDEDSLGRYADSAQMAFRTGEGVCFVHGTDGQEVFRRFSDVFEADGIRFEVPTEHMFSFNNPLGACPQCEGYGKVIGIDEDLVVPNKALSVYEDAVVCWKGEKMAKWKEKLLYAAERFDFPVHRPYFELTDEQRRLLWDGNRHFKGIHSFFEYLESKKYKIQYRVMLARYRGKTTCPLCRGTRLKKEASYVKLGGKSIPELVLMPVANLAVFFNTLNLDNHDVQVAQRILIEIKARLDYLCKVGLGYLTLNRLSSTLSGGESQRINLATTLGSSLVGSLYILDEPSIGLHPRDTGLLVDVLRSLQEIGNTVLVVEHDEAIIRSADEIIDIGPHAGRLGGELVYQGSYKKFLQGKKGLTAEYLLGLKKIDLPNTRRKWNNCVRISGARENNLKNIDIRFPLGILTVVTGVSGSGKSSLVKSILAPALSKYLNGTGEKSGQFGRLDGDMHLLTGLEFVDQNPIGKSSRSNPVTYIKAFDEIRKLFAGLPQSRLNGFTPSHFSFNIDGGRCEECQGEGEIKVEMQFMADVHLECESCHGRRFKEDVLDVTFHGKNIFDILEMTVEEALAFFGSHKGTIEKTITRKLQPLADVGLEYVKLGQSSTTLSGGESQRVKLAAYLSQEHATGQQMFIFDEPTTGLHFHDIRKLLDSFFALIGRGHSLVVIEHNPEVIKMADWVIDLGPEGGEAGGHVVFEGTPEDLAACRDSYTGRFLVPYLKRD